MYTYWILEFLQAYQSNPHLEVNRTFAFKKSYTGSPEERERLYIVVSNLNLFNLGDFETNKPINE